MAWQPDVAGLQQLSEYLKNSLSGHDRNKQKEAELVSSSIDWQDLCSGLVGYMRSVHSRESG